MHTLQQVLSDLRKERMVILVDEKDRENEGDLICAAQYITPQQVNFMAREGRGLICVPLSTTRASELALSPMVARHSMPLQHSNFTESVDAHRGVTTGISAYDRSTTIAALAATKTLPEDLSRPGHVFPLISREGGVLVRPGHTEGTLDLLRLAGLREVGVLCEIMGDDGDMLRGKRLVQFARKHKLKLFSIRDLIAYRRTHEPLVTRAVESRMPTEYGEFRAIVYRTSIDKKEHIALVKGKLKHGSSVLVRVHCECLTGDVFHSTRCDCYWQLDKSLKKIAENGSGVLLYLRHEGRGIGLVNKLKAYNLQDKGYDTVSANEKLGFKPDLREYGVGSLILKDLGISQLRLMTNNPQKIAGLDGYGLKIVERIPLEITPRDVRDRKYLKAKKIKLGHLLSKI